jgi:hypothetical protein
MGDGLTQGDSEKLSDLLLVWEDAWEKVTDLLSAQSSHKQIGNNFTVEWSSRDDILKVPNHSTEQ